MGTHPVLGQETPIARIQHRVVMPGLCLLGIGALLLGLQSWRYGALFIIGTLLGMSLYHAAFGFTSAYRNALLRRDVGGIKAQILMIGFAMLLFAPVLAAGEAFGQQVGGAVAPVGLRVVIGSFLFGLGMQLGGGCGSGTLYTVGGGSTRMVATLICFCLGAFVGSLDAERWAAAPSLPALSLGQTLGWLPALLLQACMLALFWFGLQRWAGTRPQRPLWQADINMRHLLSGPWPLIMSAGLLALLNWLTLIIAGHPWTVTWAFTLWAAKAAALIGWDPAQTLFWDGGFPARALASRLFEDHISIMNGGIMLGAMIAAGLAGRFAPTRTVPLRSLLAAILGGLLMGYGARLAFGCNIGAFFSGAASFSLHAWVWIIFALLGTAIGIRFRPWFGLAN